MGLESLISGSRDSVNSFSGIRVLSSRAARVVARAKVGRMDPVPTTTTTAGSPCSIRPGRGPGVGACAIPMVARVCGIVAGVVVPVVCFASSYRDDADPATVAVGGLSRLRAVDAVGPQRVAVLPAAGVLDGVHARRVRRAASAGGGAAVGRVRTVGGGWAGLQFGMTLLASLNVQQGEPGALGWGC